MKIFHTDIAVLTGNLFKLERCGKFEEALSELGNIWEDTNDLPEVDNLTPRAAAEIILRCGALIGFLGHNKQIPNSQEKSKNLLTEARNRFLDIYDVEKIAECENYLALAYWRTGELVEAETWVEESLLHNISGHCQTRLYSYIIRCLIYFQLKKTDENFEFFNEFENVFVNFASDDLKGDFYLYFGLALRNSNQKPEALEKYNLAKKYHQKADHQISLGILENNVAYLHKSEGRFAESHQAIDNSTQIFRQIKDRTREGFSLDTKAQIYCAEQEFEKALETIEKAVGILGKSENADYVVETYLSKAKILLYLDNFTAGFMCLSDAVQIARTKISEAKAEKLVKEFEAVLKEKNNPVIAKTLAEKESTGGKLELILHPSIAHYQEFQAVWMKNSHLESVGLPKGSLAVVTKDNIKRGDLVAITEIATDSVLCGFYDSDFGLVCLERIGEEPQLFNEDEIQILGKIIGVGNSNDKGKMHIEPINL